MPTKAIIVYTSESRKESLLSLETELDQNMYDAIEKVKGSGWSIYRYKNMFSVLHNMKVQRAGS